MAILFNVLDYGRTGPPSSTPQKRMTKNGAKKGREGQARQRQLNCLAWLGWLAWLARQADQQAGKQCQLPGVTRSIINKIYKWQQSGNNKIKLKATQHTPRLAITE